MSLFKITVQSSGGGDLGALPVCTPRPKPVCYSTLESLGTGPEAEAAAQEGVEDILGDILAISAAEEAEKQERERKAAGLEPEGQIDAQAVSRLLAAVSPDILPFAQKVVALAVDGDKLANILGVNPTDVFTHLAFILEWLSEEVARTFGVDVPYFRYLLRRMIDDPESTLRYGLNIETTEGGVVIKPQFELEGNHPLESVRFSVLQGKSQAGTANREERDEFRIMLEERAADTDRGEHRRYQFQAQYNQYGGRERGEVFFNALSGPVKKELQEQPLEGVGYRFTKGISAYGVALNASWRSTTQSAPNAAGVDIANRGAPRIRKKFKYHPK